MAEKKIVLREEVRRTIETLEVLMPSRNYLIQLLMLLPLEYNEIKEMYSEFTEDLEYWNFLCSVLGLKKIDEKRYEVMSNYNLARVLKLFVENLFQVVRSDVNRAMLSSILGRVVPNYEKEWLEVRLKTLLGEKSLSSGVKKVLRVLCSRDSVSFSEIKEETGLNVDELDKVLYALKVLKIIEELYNGKYRLREDVAYYKQYIVEVMSSE